MSHDLHLTNVINSGIVPATLAAMVKMFFRELPEPILTFNMYHDFMNTSSKSRVQLSVNTVDT